MVLMVRHWDVGRKLGGHSDQPFCGVLCVGGKYFQMVNDANIWKLGRRGHRKKCISSCI